MKIGIANDHRGFDLKEQIVESLKDKYEFVDVGAYSTDAVDYPDYAFKLGEMVRDKVVDFGVAICGSGIGISIACNKVKGIRCAKVSSLDDVIYTRLDNDSNIVAFSANTKIDDACLYVEKFVETAFSSEERHQKRIDKIRKYEEENER